FRTSRGCLSRFRLARNSSAAETRPLRKHFYGADGSPSSASSVLVLCELIAAPFEGGAQTFLLSDLVEFDADVRFCRIEWSHHVEPSMHGIGEAHSVGAAVYGQLGMRERFR